MLAAVVQSWDTSCVHCVKVGIPICTELGHELCALCESWYTTVVYQLSQSLTQHVSGIIIPIVRRTDYVNNCMWNMPGCVGCSDAELGHELCALCESWYTNNDARNMLS